MGPPANMRSTSAGSDLNPQAGEFSPGVWREAQAWNGNGYDGRDLQSTNSHAHPENTQLSEPSMSNLASGHGDQTPSAATNTEREYVGYYVANSPTSSPKFGTKKAVVKKQDYQSERLFPPMDKSPFKGNKKMGKRKASAPKEASSQKKRLQGQKNANYGTGQSSRTTLPENSGGYELANGTPQNSEIDNNSSKGKSKEATPRMSSGKDSDIHTPMSFSEDSNIYKISEKSKGKGKATETTHPTPYPGVNVRENLQDDGPSGATATTSNLEAIAGSDEVSIRTRKPSDVPGNESENEDGANGGSVGSGGEGVGDGDPSSSTRPAKKRRRRKKKSTQSKEKIEETVNGEAAKEARLSEEEEQMYLCKSILSCLLAHQCPMSNVTISEK
jgi:hypothetical protein